MNQKPQYGRSQFKAEKGLIFPRERSKRDEGMREAKAFEALGGPTLARRYLWTDARFSFRSLNPKSNLETRAGFVEGQRGATEGAKNCWLPREGVQPNPLGPPEMKGPKVLRTGEPGVLQDSAGWQELSQGDPPPQAQKVPGSQRHLQGRLPRKLKSSGSLGFAKQQGLWPQGVRGLEISLPPCGGIPSPHRPTPPYREVGVLGPQRLLVIFRVFCREKKKPFQQMKWRKQSTGEVNLPSRRSRNGW